VQNSVGAAHRNCLGWKGEKVPEGRKAMGDYEVLKRFTESPFFSYCSFTICGGLVWQVTHTAQRVQAVHRGSIIRQDQTRFWLHTRFRWNCQRLL
jgi:hypothetical protein